MGKLPQEVRMTREYKRIIARIEKLQERANEIKGAIQQNFPEGVDTPEGTWTIVKEGMRETYASSKMQNVVEELLLNGNEEIAKMILKQRTESIVKSSVRFKGK